MAWRMSNTFFLAPGATTIIQFLWPPGVDHGPQWVLPHPLSGERVAWLVTERVGKSLICEVAEGSQEGFRCWGVSDYEYRVWITNDDAVGCRFQIEGGSV